MSKLIYKTKKATYPYIGYELFMKHEYIRFGDKVPPDNIQEKAFKKVLQSMEKLLKDLEILGYDPTKVSFLIHYNKI